LQKLATFVPTEDEMCCVIYECRNIPFKWMRGSGVRLNALKMAIVATERHLWLNPADIREKEKGFLLDSLVSPSELFSALEAVVGKFREAKARSAAFRTCIPLRSAFMPRQVRGP